MQNDFNQNLPPVSEASTVYSKTYELSGEETKSLDLRVEALALSGPSTSVVPTVQFSDDNSAWQDTKVYDALIAPGSIEKSVPAIKRYVRIKFVVTGAAPVVELSVFMQGRNTAPVAGQDEPIANVPLTANTEASYAIPMFTSKFLLKTRNGSPLQFCFKSGESNTTFVTLPVGSSGLWIDAVSYRGKTVYFRTTESGETAEILAIS